MEWIPRTLDELGYVSRGRSRHRPRDAAHLYGGPYPFVQTGDIKHAGLYLNQYSQTYSEAGLKQSRLWPAGTLCITIAANIAETSILGIEACFPDSVIGFIPDKERANARFLKYLFDAILQRRFKQFTQGAAQDNLSQAKLLSLELLVPPLAEQTRIASILSAYDALIENNRRRIQLLEQAARLLYKEWFVRLRFPGHERVTVTDGVPEGWERKAVPEILETNPKEVAPKDVAIRYIPMAGLSTSAMTVDLNESEMRTKSTSVRFRNGDTLFARITPCLENGKTGFVNFLRDDEVACGSTEFIVLRGRSVSPYFTYCLARTYDFRQAAIKSMIGSSGRQRVQPSCFDDFLVARPSPFIRDKFDNICKPIFTQIAKITSQIQSLAQARDLLLPRLMRGDVEAE